MIMISLFWFLPCTIFFPMWAFHLTFCMFWLLQLLIKLQIRCVKVFYLDFWRKYYQPGLWWSKQWRGWRLHSKSFRGYNFHTSTVLLLETHKYEIKFVVTEKWCIRILREFNSMRSVCLWLWELMNQNFEQGKQISFSSKTSYAK